MPETGAIQLGIKGRENGEGGVCHPQLSLPQLGPGGRDKYMPEAGVTGGGGRPPVAGQG